MHVLIGKDNRCTCNCASKCCKNKTGSSLRCTKEEIEEEGHYTVLVKKNWMGRLTISNYRQLNIL